MYKAVVLHGTALIPTEIIALVLLEYGPNRDTWKLCPKLAIQQEHLRIE